LAHQADAERLVAKWPTQLRAGGRLLIEEMDSMVTRQPVFRQYLEIVESMLAAGGHDLYVGRRLAAMPVPDRHVKLTDRSVALSLTDDLAARMFWLNIQTWRHNAYVQANYSSRLIQGMTASLAEIAAAPSDEQGIAWQLRQLVFEHEA
jgi:hypothetical protein